ncbi:MAG: GNAT family N-acetyltransferase [Candidatus Phaeomarinobacter sp.]
MVEMRTAGTTDAEAIARIHVACWREVYSFMPQHVHASRDYAFRLDQWTRALEDNDPDQQILVIEDEAEIVGFTMVKPNDDADIPDARGELHAAYFLPKYRGHAIGIHALNRMIHFLWSRDLWPVCLWAFKDNPVRKKYEEAGWTPVVYRDRDVAGELIPEVGYTLANEMAEVYLHINNRLVEENDQTRLTPPA